MRMKIMKTKIMKVKINENESNENKLCQKLLWKFESRGPRNGLNASGVEVRLDNRGRLHWN